MKARTLGSRNGLKEKRLDFGPRECKQHNLCSEYVILTDFHSYPHKRGYDYILILDRHTHCIVQQDTVVNVGADGRLVWTAKARVLMYRKQAEGWGIADLVKESVVEVGANGTHNLPKNLMMAVYKQAVIMYESL